MDYTTIDSLNFALQAPSTKAKIFWWVVTVVTVVTVVGVVACLIQRYAENPTMIVTTVRISVS